MNKIRIAGAAAGLVLVSGVVLQVSSAAFTGSTENAGNSWTAGTVTLTDSRSGSALFQSTAQVPGDTETQCIEVTYTGTATPDAPISLSGAVTSTAGGGDGGDGLADDLDVVIDVGTSCDALTDLVGGLLTPVTGATVTNVYTGTLATFDDAARNTQWTPDPEGGSANEMRAFRFTVTLGADTPNDAQGDTAGATFTWSATAGTS